MECIQQRFGISQRRACGILGYPRSTQRYGATIADDEPRLVRRIEELAQKYGRYGYRRVAALLRMEGWRVNHKRVERLWRREGLKVPQRQSRRRRLWWHDGGCYRLRPLYKNHVWSYDFVASRTSDGRPLRFLTIIDEYTRECLWIDVGRRLKSDDVLDRLTDLFIRHGIPEHIRSDNGSEFIAKEVKEWLGLLGVRPLYIEPGSPWENGYIESFNGKFRDEFLNVEILDTLMEAKVLTERWRQRYNHIRPHSSLGYRLPAPAARQSCPSGSAPPRLQDRTVPVAAALT